MSFQRRHSTEPVDIWRLWHTTWSRSRTSVNSEPANVRTRNSLRLNVAPTSACSGVMTLRKDLQECTTASPPPPTHTAELTDPSKSKFHWDKFLVPKGIVLPLCFNIICFLLFIDIRRTNWSKYMCTNKLRNLWQIFFVIFQGWDNFEILKILEFHLCNRRFDFFLIWSEKNWLQYISEVKSGVFWEKAFPVYGYTCREPYFISCKRNNLKSNSVCQIQSNIWNETHQSALNWMESKLL
jgi:hypothetical protein